MLLKLEQHVRRQRGLEPIFFHARHRQSVRTFRLTERSDQDLVQRGHRR